MGRRYNAILVLLLTFFFFRLKCMASYQNLIGNYVLNILVIYIHMLMYSLFLRYFLWDRKSLTILVFCAGVVVGANSHYICNLRTCTIHYISNSEGNFTISTSSSLCIRTSISRDLDTFLQEFFHHSHHSRNNHIIGSQSLKIFTSCCFVLIDLRRTTTRLSCYIIAFVVVLY